MKYDNSLFYIEKINPRPTKKFVYRFDLFVALSLPFAEQRIEVQGQRGKRSRRGRENPSFPRTNRSRAPTTTTERQYERAWALLPCCGARKQAIVPQNRSGTACLPEKRQSRFSEEYALARRISTAATRANRRLSQINARKLPVCPKSP